MSRTRHIPFSEAIHNSFAESPKYSGNRQSSRPQLTKGNQAGKYTRSEVDYSSGYGGKNWAGWLYDYCGYGKQRKRRRQRKILKTYGRRSERRKLNRLTEEE